MWNPECGTETVELRMRNSEMGNSKWGTQDGSFPTATRLIRVEDEFRRWNAYNDLNAQQ